jgi:hypothetical protein
MHAVDVLGAGLGAHQDDALALRCLGLGLVGGERRLNAALPDAAPGEAGRPLEMIWRSAFGSRVGCNSWSSALGSIRLTAVGRSIRPLSAISTAIRKAAWVVRLPLRVCSIHSLFFWTVNSISCMSR